MKIGFFKLYILIYTKVQQEYIGRASFEKKPSIVHLHRYVGIFDIYLELFQKCFQQSLKDNETAPKYH